MANNHPAKEPKLTRHRRQPDERDYGMGSRIFRVDLKNWFTRDNRGEFATKVDLKRGIPTSLAARGAWVTSTAALIAKVRKAYLVCDE